MARQIYTEAQANEYIREMAHTHQAYYDRDMDALLEIGEADMDTILEGYLWNAICTDMGEMDEDTEEVLSCAIVDFYIDMVECDE